jgi:hypothetical protein
MAPDLGRADNVGQVHQRGRAETSEAGTAPRCRRCGGRQPRGLGPNGRRWSTSLSQSTGGRPHRVTPPSPFVPSGGYPVRLGRLVGLRDELATTISSLGNRNGQTPIEAATTVEDDPTASPFKSASILLPTNATAPVAIPDLLGNRHDRARLHRWRDPAVPVRQASRQPAPGHLLTVRSCDARERVGRRGRSDRRR